MASMNIQDTINSYLTNKNDYGFTSTPVPDSKEVSDARRDLVDRERRLAAIEQLIMPLLANLLSSSDKPNILWPNRKPILEEKIKELLTLTRIDQ